MAEINKLDINGYTMESIYAKIGISYDRFVELLDRDFYTPTLTAAPTASTLTYTDTDGSVCEFRIGQSCVYPDSSMFDGLGISILKAITKDGAVWEKTIGKTPCLLNIKLTSDLSNNDNGLLGAVIIVKDTETEATIDTQTWNGKDISIPVSFGRSYNITVSDVDKYITPTAKTYEVTTIGSHNIELTYIRPSWITLNQTITDPATMLSGDINGTHIQAIRNNSHRYLGKYTAERTMTICQLDDTDSNLYKDGTTATLTGADGDVFMKLPRFWYQTKEKATNIWEIGFYYGDTAPAGSWKEWDGKDLIGVYEAYNTDSKVYSRSGVTSTGDVSQANFKAYARARGTGFSIVKWKHQNIMAFLYYAMYGHMNCQAQIGAGTNSYSKQTGQTNALGMEDTVASVNGNSQSINFWGLENWWGNMYEWVDNVVVNPESGNGLWRITEDDDTTRDVQGARLNGYMETAVIGEHLDLIPSSTSSASNTTGYCDYVNNGNNKTSRVVLRSYYYANTYGGVACAAAMFDSSYSSSIYGSRLAFRGTLVEAESVEAFQSLSAIG